MKQCERDLTFLVVSLDTSKKLSYNNTSESGEEDV